MAETFAESDIGALIRDAVKRQAPQVIEVTDPATDKKIPVLLKPTGNGAMEIAGLDGIVAQWRGQPVRRKGVANLVDLASFIAHVVRFKDGNSALFANPVGPTITGMLDYHEAGDGKPRFGEHRAAYAFPVSREWKAWTAKNGEKMAQGDFAAFIEDRIQDVGDPPMDDTGGAVKPSADDEKLLAVARRVGARYGGPQRLLELSRGLAIKADVQASSAVTLQSGEGQVEFVEAHTDKTGARLSVPGLFVIQIPVFDAGPLYRLPVRLRYRLSAGRIVWFYELWHHDRAKDDAFREQCETAAKETDLPLFYGSPE